MPGKLAERIVHTHISNFLDDKELLNENQGGFRKHRSTISTTAKFIDDILIEMNERQYTVACFIDLKKAFDTINHQILMQKLPHFGINDKTCNWVQNYLENRKQKCTVNGRTSCVRDITCGVPQGSILGPLLFLLFVNDMDQDLIHSKVLLYADDTVLYASNNHEEVAHLWVSENLQLISKWCSANQLTINTNKTKVMLFGTRNMLKRGIKYDTFVDDTKVQYVNHFNYLGIKLDNSLTFEQHAAESLKMVSHKSYLLSRIRKYITTGQAITIYKSKIVPYFDYGDVFLMNIIMKTRQKLQRLQNRALRICLNAEGRSNVNMLHNTCNVNKLDDRRTTHLLNFVYSRAQGEEHTNVGARVLRRYDAPILNEIRSNNKNFERSILYQGAIHWNSLDAESRGITTLNAFKKMQKGKLSGLLPY